MDAESRDMTTLSPFFNGLRKGVPAERKAEALGRVVSILLQGIALHSYEADSAQAEDFRVSVRKVRSDFEQTEDEDTALLLAGAAIRLMDDHNRKAQLQARARQNEFEAAIALVSEALLDVSKANAETMVRFKEMERDLASACDLESLRGVKEKLAHAVEAVRDSVANPLKAWGTKIPAGKSDPVTGLPDYGFGATAIAEVWNQRDEYYAGMFAAERLETINTRFGFQAGDGVLQVLSRHTARNLSPGDRLFRWRGPCLMALMKRDASEGLVASEMTRLTMARIQHGISLKGREIMLPISTSWNLLALGAASGIDEVLTRMNTFAASRLPAKRQSAMLTSIE
jgi:GGDEF domain-containing protein